MAFQQPHSDQLFFMLLEFSFTCVISRGLTAIVSIIRTGWCFYFVLVCFLVCGCLFASLVIVSRQLLKAAIVWTLCDLYTTESFMLFDVQNVGILCINYPFLLDVFSITIHKHFRLWAKYLRCLTGYNTCHFIKFPCDFSIACP